MPGIIGKFLTFLPQTLIFTLSCSLFVGLIITNCIVMGRAEAFALQNPPKESILDGIGNGLGYSIILILVGTIRELFGSESLRYSLLIVLTLFKSWSAVHFFIAGRTVVADLARAPE